MIACNPYCKLSHVDDQTIGLDYTMESFYFNFPFTKPVLKGITLHSILFRFTECLLYQMATVLSYRLKQWL